MKSILFISNKYPNDIEKNILVFVQQLVWEFADQGINCTVICPLAINLNLKYKKIKYHYEEKTEKGNIINVYFPKFFGLGQSHYIFGKSPVRITTHFFTNSIIKTIKKNNIIFNCVYGHFVAPAGVASARIGKEFNVPSFFAHGESTSWSISQFGKENLKQEFNNISGVIAVSTRNKNMVIDNDLVDKSKIEVFPNGYRKERFYKIDKNKARDHFNWDQNKFIVGFCGSFDERKGILRVQQAVDEIDDNEIVFACAGKGDKVPTSAKCIWKKPVNNNELLYFYNAIDVFCLPTQNEGCCNAIIEAMACGCPIISSDRDFNYDILNNNNSILIDPNNISDISKAIKSLKENNKTEKMSIESQKAAQKLTITKRVKRIKTFMEERERMFNEKKTAK